MAHADAEHVQVEDRAQWRAWLAAHHASSPGVWLVTFKKGTGHPAPSYDEIVEEALCFGWVDSRPGRVDDERTRLYVSPRKKGSGWAATNKARVERLVSAGLMTEAGQLVIDRAKADGSWTVLDSSEAAEVPDDLRAAFRRHRGSEAQFAAFPPGVRKQILQWIAQAKRPDTRASRVEETARLAKDGIRANQWTPKNR